MQYPGMAYGVLAAGGQTLSVVGVKAASEESCRHRAQPGVEAVEEVEARNQSLVWA